MGQGAPDPRGHTVGGARPSKTHANEREPEAKACVRTPYPTTLARLPRRKDKSSGALERSLSWGACLPTMGCMPSCYGVRAFLLWGACLPTMRCVPSYYGVVHTYPGGAARVCVVLVLSDFTPDTKLRRSDVTAPHLASRARLGVRNSNGQPNTKYLSI